MIELLLGVALAAFFTYVVYQLWLFSTWEIDIDVSDDPNLKGKL